MPFGLLPVLAAVRAARGVVLLAAVPVRCGRGLARCAALVLLGAAVQAAGAGAWMRRQRKAEALGADQAAKLEALDELWRLEPDWNRSYRRLVAYPPPAEPWTARPTAPAAKPTRRSGPAPPPGVGGRTARR
ncbi:hypothetical protein ACFV1W_40315 [Kitasatospora sp. NPDC059648]|uniref:hypothetical protein n=1 Tax=Kitasatospora sp. NPDC059648 TaxID=3346894 RepID=UPI0036A72177